MLARHRLSPRSADLQLVQQAGPFIVELGEALDRELLHEQRPGERLRLLREATNRITRTANDAVHAYRRASRAIATELDRPDANTASATAMRDRLEEARANVLAALDAAARRYPWAHDDDAEDQATSGRA